MTAEEAIAYIEDYSWSASRLGLERTVCLLEGLGDPQKGLRFIHVAGSNGKGSCCAMLESILRRAGYKTGLYTSPYIEEFCERIRIDGNNIDGDILAKHTERVRRVADGMDDHPSQFELVTAVAMCCFADCGCDIVVLEVGLGGALDSTNVIDVPEIAVITNIGLEHTEYLGDTLEKIAAAKGGIIKDGGTAVCYECDPAVNTVIESICRDRHAKLCFSREEDVRSMHRDLSGQSFLWKGKEYRIPLLGQHQLRNAALVLETVDRLRDKSWHICEDAVTEGLACTEWPARMELLSRKPLFILDGGHNPQCAAAAAECLNDLLPDTKMTFLMGVMADKDHAEMLRILAPLAERFVCVTPDNGRALSASGLCSEILAMGIPAVTAPSPTEGIVCALELSEGSPVVAIGSLYMAGAIRSGFKNALRKRSRQHGIRARSALIPQEREKLSAIVCERIAVSEEFRQAETILLYDHVGAELSLNALKSHPLAAGKRFAYPLCISKTEMLALIPEDETAWKIGRFGIREPIAERSETVSPETLDLVICPCTAFDPDRHRMGMGGGFYDRFLPSCTRAHIFAAAFEVQKQDQIPCESWDQAMDTVFTDAGKY